ncbi:uncharacterized protein Z518_10359 [Rhinocladiella mackenziei CBS 650.93]|uniref:Rhinocladiella mackenziei CBS 650.93 unplaced genomic scaffold supercont1.9, whole genome shotgun sequence n=1 Tax=Rhinocladiella mackenziei CBS 650.93 TaxID=1442369 RepID=A0A0D2ITZ1_9EURO|nr:uncharacterized protein Z518_10359 [Rhinocladiella mackenziei CBS 650.93]KIX00220.1 hypothetical protein Z518_10359 [Rhinocladiella mackenziei CBS 650.93]
MGFWNDGIRSSRDRSRSRSRSPYRKTYYASRPAYTRSASSFFSFSGGSSRGHGRARPRPGFINRIRRFFHDVYSYMRRHPIKVFLLVIVPLITGGALSKLLAQFGVRLPRSLENLIGGNRQRERYYARGGARDFAGGTALPGMGGGVGESLGSLMGIAKMFL